jgi:molybdenum cofactor guanylyltransferase
MIPAGEVTGVVLAGGMSTRMGRDKALLMLEGKPFIQHVAEALQEVFPEVLISANTSAYDFLGLPIVNDLHRDCGPLGGMHAALAAVKSPYIFVAPCDIPRLHPAIIATLLSGGKWHMVAIASTVDGLQPMVGIYPAACHGALDAFLASGQRRVRDFLKSVPCFHVRVECRDSRLDNINSVDLYRRLLDNS